MAACSNIPGSFAPNCTKSGRSSCHHQPKPFLWSFFMWGTAMLTRPIHQNHHSHDHIDVTSGDVTVACFRLLTTNEKPPLSYNCIQKGPALANWAPYLVIVDSPSHWLEGGWFQFKLIAELLYKVTFAPIFSSIAKHSCNLEKRPLGQDMKVKLANEYDPIINCEQLLEILYWVYLLMSSPPILVRPNFTRLVRWPYLGAMGGVPSMDWPLRSPWALKSFKQKDLLEMW